MLMEDFLKELIAIPSPSGYTQRACEYIFSTLKSLGYSPRWTTKGAVACSLGKDPRLTIAAHVDTLGAVVSGFYPDGALKISPIGGWAPNSFEGEYVTIMTLNDKVYTGTLLMNNPSHHVNRELGKKERELANMHIRVDEKVTNIAQCQALGIQVGDIVSFDPRYQQLPNGYIKSRFLDNKACCAVLLQMAAVLKQENQSLPVEIYFSNYEEVGHGGASGYSPGIEELLVVDMGVVGDECQGSEFACSICAKDSSGPYDYEFRKQLVALADSQKIPYKIDVYPYYGSDGSAALRAGWDVRVALIGPGVAASHNMERTHWDAIDATRKLCLAYSRTLLN